MSDHEKVAYKGLRLLEKIVDGDDRFEWDSGGGGYRHANKTEPRSGNYHLELKAISNETKDPYCYIYKDLKAEPEFQKYYKPKILLIVYLNTIH